MRNAALLGWLCLFVLALPCVRAQDASSAADAEVKAGDVVRLRAGPTTNDAILTLLPGGTALTILGLSQDRHWLQVRIPAGEMGWVAAEYIDVAIDMTAAFPVGGNPIRLPSDVVDHIRRIYADGQTRGNHADIFAKVGDSITASILTLNPIGEGKYSLGTFTYLQDVIHFYSSAQTRDGHNSFNDDSLAAAISWTTYRVLNPAESNPDLCQPDEPPLLCEYRLLKPSLALIMLGTNDVSVLDPASYRANLNRIATLTERQGVIPILTTIPVRIGYEDRVKSFNQIVIDVARQHTIPLLDYGGAMESLGTDGLDLDQVHPSIPPKGYDGAADFRAQNLDYGYVVRNLTALQMLDAVWRATASASS